MAASATGNWAGFSDEELNRIRTQEQNGECEDITSLKSTSLKRSRNKKRPSHRVSSNSSQSKYIANDADSNPNPNQLLAPVSQTQTQTSHQATRLKTSQVGLNLPTSPVCLRINEDGRVLEILENNHDELNSKSENNMQLKCGSEELGKGVSNDLSTLEKFEQRQKMMEEQNRQRRSLLSKALVERRKKTQEETVKLSHIQQELAKLDSLVSADVAILRKQIELSSVEFNEAQKRYKKAEEEFVEAKVELFKRMEKKEQLTEHLCTIIEHNETRKAQKLAELMKELEMESLIEECEQEGIGPMLSQLCALNDVCYNSCSTIKDPNVNRSLPTTPDAKSESQNDNLMAGDSGCDTLNESTENEMNTKTDISNAENSILSIEEKCSEC